MAHPNPGSDRVKQIRSVLELAVPVWQPALTNHDRAQIERVQKTALSIILGKNYGSYRNALHIMEMETLEDRRKSLCLKFQGISPPHLQELVQGAQLAVKTKKRN